MSLALVILMVCMLSAATAFAAVERLEGENLPASVFTGSWQNWPHPDQSNGDCKYTTQAGDTATYEFSGTGIDWIALKYSSQGSATVWVDSETPQTVILNLDPSSPILFKQVVWSKRGLSNGPHTLHIASVGGGNINIDALDVFVEPPVVSTSASSPLILVLLGAVGLAAAGAMMSRRQTGV